MNKDSLRAKCHKISKETGLSFNIVQTHYFLESILKKISESEENENFIFKGGFLLSNVIGIRQRTTVDIDFMIKRFSLTEQNIKQKFEDILQNSNDCNISYEIQKVEEIRKKDNYGGYRITILCRLENIRQTIPLDIATGEPVTPGEILYEYKSIFGDQIFEICAYNIETMLAEKLHTIYQRGVFNSRSKDFYDIFIIFRMKREEIDYTVLKKACINTFEHRNTNFSIGNILSVLYSLKEENSLQTMWKNYQERFSYAKGIAFGEIVDTTIEQVEKLKA